MPVTSPLTVALPVMAALGLAGSGVHSDLWTLGRPQSGAGMVLAALLIAVACLPGLLRGKAQRLLVIAGGLVACASWGLAAGSSWPVTGWAAAHLAMGQAAWLGVLCLSTAGLTGLAVLGATRRDDGLMHELGLHLLALTAVPAVHPVLVSLGARAGLGSTDAWLGAAVLAPGVLLSFSFYATAFRGRGSLGQLQLPRSASGIQRDATRPGVPST